DHDRGHLEHSQARREADAALAAADDHAVRLRDVAELGLGPALALQPALAVPECAPLDALRTRGAGLLLEALQLVQRREQRPALSVAQPHVAVAAADGGLERD